MRWPETLEIEERAKAQADWTKFWREALDNMLIAQFPPGPRLLLFARLNKQIRGVDDE